MGRLQSCIMGRLQSFAKEFFQAQNTSLFSVSVESN